MELTIECKKRPEGTNPRAMRREGLIPAVLYGHKGAESDSFALDAKSVTTLLKQVRINNTLVQVNIPHLPWSGKALLREVQTHPWRGYPYHLSFYAPTAHHDVEVRIPIHYLGEPIGVRLEGGAMDPVLTELMVRVLPDAIPEYIEVNVADMHIGQALHVGDLVLPEGVRAVDAPDVVAMSVLGKGSQMSDEAEAGAAG